jgi:hypothetical protein
MTKASLDESLITLVNLIKDGSLTAEEGLHRAALLGADQELTECCNHLKNNCPSISMEVVHKFYKARRPTLKQQSIELLNRIQSNNSLWQLDELDVIRKALEIIPN